MIDVELDIGLDWRKSGFGQVEVEKAVDAAVKFAGLPGLSDYPAPIEVSIKLSDNDEVHALNREWRDKDKPTNVLSFPTLEDDDLNSLRHPELVFPSANQVQGDEPEMELLLGDIILAYGVCEAEAAEKNIPIADHATHLVIHGMLHLLGHDHIDNDDAEAMEALEVKALASIGLDNPYSE